MVVPYVQGIFLNIDNNLLTQCQNAANQAMIAVCGDTSTCLAFNDDMVIGTGSMLSTRTASGDYLVDGLISFGNLVITKQESEASSDIYNLDVDSYMNYIAEQGADEAVQTRIRSSLSGIAQEIKRRMDVIAADPVVSMCINGRDISQIAGREIIHREQSETDEEEREMTTARFPHLLDSYSSIIANSAMIIAKDNYDREYAKIVSSANTASAEYQNQIYCTALAQRDQYVGLRPGEESGIKNVTEYSMVLTGVTSDEMLDALIASSEISNVLLDTDDRMIGLQNISSIYEPSTQTCRITTTTYPCTGFEGIYNSSSRSFGMNVGVTVAGTGGNVGFNNSRSSTTYKGNFCDSYAEPVISEQIINLGSSGAGLYETTTTRSNLQSYYNDSSMYQDNSSEGGFSLGLSADLSNVGNVGGNKTNNTIDSNNRTTTNSNNKTTTSSGRSALSSPISSSQAALNRSIESGVRSDISNRLQ